MSHSGRPDCGSGGGGSGSGCDGGVGGGSGGGVGGGRSIGASKLNYDRKDWAYFLEGVHGLLSEGHWAVLNDRRSDIIPPCG